MKRDKAIIAMKIGAMLAFVIAIYATVTYGQGVIHSDSATTNRLFKSMCSSGGFYPKTWNFYNYELYSFSIQNIGAYIQFLIINTIIARVLAQVFVLMLACYSIIWFSRKIFKDISYTIIIPIIFVVMSGTNYWDMFLYQAAYVIQIFVIALLYGMAYKVINKNEANIYYKIVHIIFMFIFMMGGLRYAAEYVIPFSGMLFINGILALAKREKDTVINYVKNYIVLFVIPTLLGFLIYKYVCVTHASHVLGNQVGTIKFDVTPTEFISNVITTIRNLFYSFGFVNDGFVIKNIVAIMVALLVFIVLPIIQIFDFKNLSKEELDYTSFTIIHNMIMLTVVLLGSKTYQRYIFTSIYLTAFISGNCITRKFFSHGGFKKILTSIICLTLTIVYTIGLFISTFGWQQMVSRQKKQCKDLIDKGVTKVYASYWIAYPYEIYSNNKLSAGAISIRPRNLQKNYLLADDSEFDTINGRSAIVMTQKEADDCSDAVHIICGQQDEDFLIKDAIVSDNENYYTSDLVVYVFNEDVGDKLSDGFRDGFLDIKDVDFNWYGTITDDAIIMGENGMIHGPYSFLEKGHYSLSIEGQGLVGCNCTVTSDIAPDSISFTVNDIKADHIDIDLMLEGGIEDLQVYLSNPMPDKIVEFYGIKVKKL